MNDKYRVLQKRVFHFDTNNRTEGTLNNPRFVFRRDIFQVADPAISLRFSLLQATVPYTWNNINDGTGNTYANNWLELIDDNVITRVSIPAGNYSIQQLLSLLKNQLNSVSTKDFNFSFNPITLKATWSYNQVGDVAFRFSPVASESLKTVLGFKATPQQITFPFVNNSITSEFPVNVSQTSDVFISITNLQGISYEYLNGVFTNSPLFCILPITVPFFSNITYISRKENEYEFITSSQAIPDSFEFLLTNQYDEPLPLNRDWNITLICEWITTAPKPQSEYFLLEKLLLTTYKIAEDMEVVKAKSIKNDIRQQ